MIPVSQLFKNYAAMSDRAIEAKAIINGVPFLDDAIVSVDIEESILNGEELAFGSALSSKLTLKLFSTADVAKNAEVKIEIRMNGADGYTEWVPYGTFYVDERVLTENVWTFTCYDLLIKSNQPFETQLIYPTSFGSAFLEILVFLGATVEENTLTLINGCGHQIPYKDEDLTVNEMLSYMAASLGVFL